MSNIAFNFLMIVLAVIDVYMIPIRHIRYLKVKTDDVTNEMI